MRSILMYFFCTGHSLRFLSTLIHHSFTGSLLVLSHQLLKYFISMVQYSITFMFLLACQTYFHIAWWVTTCFYLHPSSQFLVSTHSFQQAASYPITFLSTFAHLKFSIHFPVLNIPPTCSDTSPCYDLHCLRITCNPWFYFPVFVFLGLWWGNF